MRTDLLADIPLTVRERAGRIRLAAFDVDGTLTDGRLWVSTDGHDIKGFHAHDGLGLKRLQAHGIAVALVTARISHAVSMRAEELGIDHLYQGQDDKAACMRELVDALQLAPEETAFVGDDLPDLRAMRGAGLAVAVANAHPLVIEQAHWTTPHPGGAGAARDACDLILAAKGLLAGELERWL